MKEPCAQCRIEIAAGERTERDPECFACGGNDRWINTRTGERFIVTAKATHTEPATFAWADDERVPRPPEPLVSPDPIPYTQIWDDGTIGYDAEGTEHHVVGCNAKDHEASDRCGCNPDYHGAQGLGDSDVWIHHAFGD